MYITLHQNVSKLAWKLVFRDKNIYQRIMIKIMFHE